LNTGKNRDQPVISTAMAAGDATITAFGTRVALLTTHADWPSPMIIK
jgi:hypothetical protein